jgi:hypothetical protein
MYCISCKKNNVKPADSPEEDILWKKCDNRNINNEMVNDGIIHIIDAGYGSKHDGDQFIIAICDDCIKENLEDATLLYFNNYMYSKEEFIQEEKEKSKLKYRRRKNLDDLV